MATLGRYELLERLGQGGFATVYRAWDPRLGREVALKALRIDLAEDDDVRRRFLAEAQAMARLRHDHLVTVFDVEGASERPFFTMELLEGQTLYDLLKDGTRLDLPRVVAIVGNLADALDTLHEARLIHRDVKAANVMLARRSGRAGGERVVLMDLGIARQLDGPSTMSSSRVMLTPESASPEQIQGIPVGPASDIYSLGVVTYQMLAGRPPFLGDTARVLHAHVYEQPPPLAELRRGLPGAVYAVVEEALAKDPAKRPTSAGAFAAGLRRAAAVSAAPAPTASASADDARGWAPTRPMVVSALEAAGGNKPTGFAPLPSEERRAMSGEAPAQDARSAFPPLVPPGAHPAGTGPLADRQSARVSPAWIGALAGFALAMLATLLPWVRVSPRYYSVPPATRPLWHESSTFWALGDWLNSELPVDAFAVVALAAAGIVLLALSHRGGGAAALLIGALVAGGLLLVIGVIEFAHIQQVRGARPAMGVLVMLAGAAVAAICGYLEWQRVGGSAPSSQRAAHQSERPAG